MINEFVRTGPFDLIVVDSVAVLTPVSEIDGVKMPGQQAKMMVEQLSQLVGKVNQTKTVIIFINQIRSTMSGLFLNKENTPGGSALKFYSSVHIEVKSGEKIKDGINTIGKKQHFIQSKIRSQLLIKSQLLLIFWRRISSKNRCRYNCHSTWSSKEARRIVFI